MFQATKKTKLTLEALLHSRQIVTGKNMLEQKKQKEEENLRQKALLDDAIEFERQNRRNKVSEKL